MDYREQDGTSDYWDGGYISAGDAFEWYETLSGAVDWSGQSEALYFEIVYVHEAASGPGANEIAVVSLEGHIDDYYNGVYYQAEDWNGHPHFATGDRGAHLFYLEWANEGFWQIDYREQDGTEDLYDGGFTYAEPHIEALEGDVEWTVEGEDYSETSFYVTFTQEYWDISEAPECWGGDYDYYVSCGMEQEDMAWGDYYYDWDSDYWYYDDRSSDRSYYRDGEEFYYSGDNWSIYAERREGDTTMKARFEDFFYWAIIGESDGSGDCMEACGELETMCCAGVSLKQGDSYLVEAHCMNQLVVEENARATLGDMDVELVCKGDSSRGDGAKFLAVGASILSLIVTAMQF